MKVMASALGGQRKVRRGHALLNLAALLVFGVVGSSGGVIADEEGQRPSTRVATRIVSLAPSVTEILFAIGAGGNLVGVSSFCDYPPQVSEIPRVGTFTKPSIEAILAARSDLVIAARGPATMDAVGTIGRMGVPVLVVEDGTLADVWKAIEEIGRHTGRIDAATRVEEEMRRRLRAVRSRLAGAPRRRVLVVAGQTPLIVAGSDNFVDDLIRVAGGVNVAADTGQPWPRLSLETVLSRAPEVIIDSALSHEEGADLGLWNRFPTLPAVRDGRVHAYQSFAALRGGPRLADAAEEFARLIHPERYGLTDGQTGGGARTAGTARPATKKRTAQPAPPPSPVEGEASDRQ